MRIKEAIDLLKANGYRVTPPRAKAQAPTGLNAVGKPYGENYDPNYRMKYRPRRYAPAQSYNGSVSRHLTA